VQAHLAQSLGVVFGVTVGVDGHGRKRVA
jgi:hypothetical protein